MHEQAIDIQKWTYEKFGPVVDWDLYIDRVIEELQELKASLMTTKKEDEEAEFADVFILLLRAVVERGIDIELAIEQKMIINKNRQWTSVNGIGRSVK
jgi:NTP pyrophosphatase (non-canonical NTP hydrolase)